MKVLHEVVVMIFSHAITNLFHEWSQMNVALWFHVLKGFINKTSLINAFCNYLFNDARVKCYLILSLGHADIRLGTSRES